MLLSWDAVEGEIEPKSRRRSRFAGPRWLGLTQKDAAQRAGMTERRWRAVGVLSRGMGVEQTERWPGLWHGCDLLLRRAYLGTNPALGTGLVAWINPYKRLVGG